MRCNAGLLHILSRLRKNLFLHSPIRLCGVVLIKTQGFLYLDACVSTLIVGLKFKLNCNFFFYGACSPIGGCGLLILWGFRDHTQRHTTVGRTPLDEWSARRRDLYLTTHNTHSRQTSMPPAGFEPTISAGERPQTHVLDRAATGTGG